MWKSFSHIVEPLSNALDRATSASLTVTQPGALALALAILSMGQESSKRVSSAHSPLKTWLVLTPSEDEARQLRDDLQFFASLLGWPTDVVSALPKASREFGATSPSTDVLGLRARTLNRLVQHGLPTVVVASVEAALQKLPPPSTFADACRVLKPGMTIEREAFVSFLLQLGYERRSIVEIPGEFSVRGGIMDLFSTAYPAPLRLEFLGDTIESIRCFDPDTQESTCRQQDAWILPVGDLSIHSAIESECQEPKAHSSTAPAASACLTDYISGPGRVVLYQPMGLREASERVWNDLLEQWNRQLTTQPNADIPAPDHQMWFWDELEARLQSWPLLSVEAVAPTDIEQSRTVRLPSQSPGSFGLGLRGKPLAETLAQINLLRHEGAVFLIARSQGQVQRLIALLSEHGFPAAPWEPAWSTTESVDQRLPFFCVQGDLSRGFLSREGRIAFLTEEELFGKAPTHRPPPKTCAAKFFSSLEDLSIGDFVVHVHHGIARYQGLRRLSIQGCESDYLLLQFAGSDTLYVPLDRINDVQRYRGADQHAPKLDRLGGTSWARTKAKVKKGIVDMTQELLSLYANREVVRRAEYHHDRMLTHEFEAAFEYEETPDQLKAIEDIRRDMESPKPMDRLICGDVGYGKTEVAMRAAFKAVQNNRQVAVLVPTTLLAHQHFETFSLRFAPFPVKIGMLSRFQSPAEIKSILKELAAGTMDIVIGTHRLLQKDVAFKNLGLVIIDEEQWFGVRHKERLKQLRTQVDVLTLTATPIPRTLQMAFSGVRDLSVIESPPPGRLAIRTRVLRFDPAVVRDAILHEMKRGGQVYYVHNRVQTMEQTGAWLRDLVPEARILMAHGQMDSKLLESVMLKFFHREADVLIASAIIQSGLDIPNANTILIERADLFGLAQLYQLRGRVGRSGQQAFAYLFISNEETLTTEAQKRLAAMEEFAELGSGFRIAAADLEIRGAGNLLGKEQSGNIAAVGLDLYLQMVEQAVQELQGRVVEEPWEPTLHLNVSAYIPEDYVDDAHQRLGLYKRLSNCEQIGDLAILHGEIHDRYGPLPEPVERLCEVMHIKLLAKRLRLESVTANDAHVTLLFHERATIPEAGIHWLLSRYDGHVQFRAPRTVTIQLTHGDWHHAYPALQTMLEGLVGASTDSGGAPSSP
ncbi:MAG: transcription-repair coupling factor [Nitrospirae bacterium]|nr:MAG: transcription-repair coupling factor [Nitrospirota bacterium]